MGKMKELAAFMKFFWKHKSVPSVHCEQLNPFHYRKKDEVIFWWAKKKSVVDTLPPPPFIQKLILLCSRTVSSPMSQNHIHL